MASFIVNLSGDRELVNEEKANELIAAITVENPTHICLSNKSFDNGAAMVISEYIESLNDIKVADISDIIAGRPTEEALRTLTIICSSLKKFELIEVNVSENALGPKGVEACRSILMGDKLERVYFCNNGLSAEATELLAKILLHEDDGNNHIVPALKLLHFYNNMSGDGGAKALATIVNSISLSLEDFRFSATRSMNIGCEAIANALISVPNLKKLDLSDNNFSGKAGEILVQVLKNKSSLEYLNLRDDSLDDIVSYESEYNLFNALVEATTTGSTLLYLDLSGNGIDDKIIENLIRALDHITSLQSLYLDDNEIGTKGCHLLSIAIKKLNNLKTLSLCTCEITASGGYAIAKAVASLPSFIKLDINGNQFSENGLDAIRNVLTKAGKILGEVDDNDEDGDDDLEEALELFDDLNNDIDEDEVCLLDTNTTANTTANNTTANTTANNTTANTTANNTTANTTANNTTANTTANNINVDVVLDDATTTTVSDTTTLTIADNDEIIENKVDELVNSLNSTHL